MQGWVGIFKRTRQYEEAIQRSCSCNPLRLQNLALSGAINHSWNPKMEEPDRNFDPNFELWTAIKEAANLPIVYGSDRKFAAENERMSDIDKLYFEIHA